MKPFINREACSNYKKALEVFESLSEEQKLKLKPFIDRISETHKKIQSVLNKSDASEVCRKCEGECCTDDAISEVDFLYTLLTATKELRKKIQEATKVENGRSCVFLGAENGCIIPPNNRAYTCNNFFCEKRPDLDKIDRKVGRNIFKEYEAFQSELYKMNFGLLL